MSLYASKDPVTGKRNYLREIIPAGPRAAREAEKASRRLGTQLDEQRSPRTAATVDQLLDKYFGMADLDASTMATYAGSSGSRVRAARSAAVI